MSHATVAPFTGSAINDYTLVTNVSTVINGVTINAWLWRRDAEIFVEGTLEGAATSVFGVDISTGTNVADYVFNSTQMQPLFAGSAAPTSAGKLKGINGTPNVINLFITNTVNPFNESFAASFLLKKTIPF